VEERLAFFETGAPPGKNADAIRKVLDQLELEREEEGEEDNMMEGVEQALPLIEAEPPRKKDKGKKDKKDKKDKKKRKLDEMEMDVDEEEDGDAGDVPVKKVKLSKEEKKALKKEKKRKQTEEGAAALAEVSDGLSVVRPRGDLPSCSRTDLQRRRKRRKGTRRRNGRRMKRRANTDDRPSTPTRLILDHIFHSCLCISVNYAQRM
jgi:hypothetical protein